MVQMTEDEKEKYISFVNQNLNKFKEWYHPIDFGFGVVAHVCEYPDYIPKPELFNNKTRGLSKWEFIIKPNLPDIKGKRVLDLGCNTWLFSIQLALSGSREVIGIDRDQSIIQKSNPELAKQDIIAQANFVKKAFEIRERKVLDNVKFINWDVSKLEKLNLGRFDLILALCLVYHELDGMPDMLRKLSEMSDHIILQTNLMHKGKLGRWASIETHVKIMEYLGFESRIVEGSKGYPMPLIICNKKLNAKRRPSLYKIKVWWLKKIIFYRTYIEIVKEKIMCIRSDLSRQ